MKSAKTWWLILACSCPAGGTAEWQLLPEAKPVAVFAGDHRKVRLTWMNTGDQAAESEIHTRLWQATSTTAIRLGETPWKTLRAQAHQTVLDDAALDFPPIKARTPFVIQWLARSNEVFGTTRVLVYPTNLLDELKRLLPRSDDQLGVLDPQQQLIPALKSAGLLFINLAEGTLTNFSGRLVLIGPCGPDEPEWAGLAGHIRQMSRNGTPVVWIQAPPTDPDKLWPSFYLVPQNRAAVVVVNPDLVTDLPDQPQSQLNLIYFCKLALEPEFFDLSDLAIQR